jgi:hypothetical protein
MVYGGRGSGQKFIQGVRFFFGKKNSCLGTADEEKQYQC